MKRLTVLFSFVALLLTAGGLQAAPPENPPEDAATKVSNAVWADDVLYGTVLTPTSFTAPPMQSTDTIYNFSMSGLMGQRAISNSAPGDSDYNGGRWWVKMVVFTPAGMAAHDPDGDGVVNFELTSEEQLLEHAANLGHFEIMDTDNYFECPLLRGESENRGRGGRP